MNRRQFLQYALACGLLPRGLYAGNSGDTGSVRPLPAGVRSGRLKPLILIELKGGNDGLNTLVPYRDDNYYRLRPTLALAQDKVLPLNDEFAWHPALKPLLPVFERGRLAMVHGVGYPQPNFSHFRSLEIWESASPAKTELEGWLYSLFESRRNAMPAELIVQGVVTGHSSGVFAGRDPRYLRIADLAKFLATARSYPEPGNSEKTNRFDHLLDTQALVKRAAQRMDDALGKAPDVTTKFPATHFGKQLEIICQCLYAGLAIPVYKAGLKSFDTHAAQAGKHAVLLTEFADAMAALQVALAKANLWNDVLIMTYSEFGRRPKENGNQGTDHGTAAPHFVLGGRVRGGLYGSPPSLENIRKANQNLEFTTDFRSLYATVAEKWWNFPRRQDFEPVDLIDKV